MKAIDGRKMRAFEFWQAIDTEAIMKESCFITGGRGSGKSTLAMWVVEKLLMHGVNVKILDSSLVWRRKSNIPHYQTLRHRRSEVSDLYQAIYDFSRLSCFEMREFCCGLMESELDKAIELTEKGIHHKVVFVLEEIQNLIPTGSLRSSDYQEISRFVTQGRNFGLSYIGLTQRLASVDVNLVEISGLKYFGKTEGDNNLRKVKSWIGKEHIETVKGLKVGEFLKQHGSNIELIKTVKFPQSRRPIKFERPKPIERPTPVIRYPTRQPTLTQRFNNWLLSKVMK